MSEPSSGDLFSSGSSGDRRDDPPFELVLRGYDKRQVLEYVMRVEQDFATLVTDRDSAYSELDAYARELETAQEELAALRQRGPEADERPTYAGLGARIEQILQLAQEEAADVRARAEQDAAETRARADGMLDQTTTRMELAERDFDVAAGLRRAEAARERASMLSAVERTLQERTERSERLMTDAEHAVHKLRAEAEDRAAELLAAARKDAAAATAEADKTLAAARLEAERLRTAATVEAEEKAAAATGAADRVVGDARAAAEQLLLAAGQESERVRTAARAEVERLAAQKARITSELTRLRETLSGVPVPVPVPRQAAPAVPVSPAVPAPGAVPVPAADAVRADGAGAGSHAARGTARVHTGPPPGGA